MFRWFVFVDFPTFSNTARSSSRRAANRIEKDLIAFCFPLRLTLAARAGRRRLGSTYRMRAADEMNQRRLRPLKPEGFVLAVLLSWQRLHRPRMRAGSFGSSPASTSSTRSSGQWSAMVLGAPHRPWCLPHPSGPSPGQTHRGSLASTRARALARCMDCGRASGACPWLSCTRRTGSRRRPGAGSRRWSIPCTSQSPIDREVYSASSWSRTSDTRDGTYR